MPLYALRVFPFLLLLISTLKAQSVLQVSDVSKQEQWVDSVFNTMSDKEKIGQLFMVAAYSNRDEEHFKSLESLIVEYGIGGLIFFQGGPVRQVILTNRFQQKSKVPLLISMDLEWGLAMRLDSTMKFPKQMTLGAIENDHLIYEMGREIAQQMRTIGVQVSFSPVVDVNSNIENPVINFRSFGESREKVAQKGLAYMKGLQDHGVIANIKHFPGHGDTDTDSHYTMPVINHNRQRLDSIELYPFRQLIDSGAMSTMVAHINIPALDEAADKPTTLSENVVTKLLKQDLNFQGLVFTDAMNMKGIANYYKPGDADLQALLAGNDAILFPMDVPKAVDRIRRAIRRKKLEQQAVDQRVKKILRAKYWTGLNQWEALSTDNLVTKLNNPSGESLRQRLFEESITVVRNESNLLPVATIDTATFASLSLNATGLTPFQQALGKYASFAHYQVGPEPDEDTYLELLNKIAHFETVVVGIHDMSNRRSSNYGLRDSDLEFLRLLRQEVNLVVTVFGNAYCLENFEEFGHLLCTYEEQDYAQQVAAQVIFGALGANGKLPVSISESFKAGDGIALQPLQRLGYSIPESVGMDSHVLSGIEQIMAEAINDEATPGAQILIARKGRIIYEKSFGHYTYDSTQVVTDQTIYDLASITKVMASLQTVMFLVDNGLIDLDKKASHYLPELKSSNKKNMILRDILTHQAGLWPFIPYYQQTLTESGMDTTFYSLGYKEGFDVEVIPGIYATESIRDSLWHWTTTARVREKEARTPYDYRYSDMGYYIMQRIAERLLNQPMADFLDQNFYQPIGAATMGYLPLCRFPQDLIAPTEADSIFRNYLIHGTVHDEGAALSGGVAGHAGIFANAIDLAKVMQMNLQGGYYGGTRYLREHVLEEFTSRQYANNRRGVGWDKPAAVFNGPTSGYASNKTFGHTGFTGTAAWADPEYDLLYIFLSNRVFPTRNNRKLIQNNIRTRIQDLIYESIWSYEKYN